MRSLTLCLSWIALLPGCGPALLSAAGLRGCGAQPVEPVAQIEEVEPEDTGDLPPGLRPLRVVQARLYQRDEEDLRQERGSGPFLLTQRDGQLFLELLTSRWGDDSGPWIADRATLQPGVLRLTSPDGQQGELDISRVYPEAHIPAAMQAQWHYVASALGTETLYDAPPEGPARRLDARGPADAEWKRIIDGPEATRRERVLGALRRGSISPGDHRWGGELRHAREQGDDLLALAIFRYFRPIGRCSMDRTPNLVAADYAALCKKLGRSGCFLQLHLRIMGNQFARVTWASYAERTHRTESDALAEVGVDPDRFFLGLLVRGQGIQRQGEISAFRLGRAIHEAGRAEVLLPVVRRWAESPGLDEYNRLRAASVAHSIVFHMGGQQEAPRLDLRMGEVAQLVFAARDRE